MSLESNVQNRSPALYMDCMKLFQQLQFHNCFNKSQNVSNVPISMGVLLFFFPPFPPCCLPTNYSADLTFSSCLRESRPICPEKGQSLCRVLVIYNSNSVPFLQFPLAQVKQLVEHILALNWSWHNCQSEKK